MLRLSEEILLLIMDNDEGDVASTVQPATLHMVLAGAVLMELALENRIDTDLQVLRIIDSTPFGDDLLDPTLIAIAKEETVRPISYWLERTARQGAVIRRKVLARLVDRGILVADDFDMYFLSHTVSRSRRYPSINGQAGEEVLVRIMKLLFSSDIPDPRDVVIVSLASSCDLFRKILSRHEMTTVSERIDLLCRMDFVSQSVAHSIQKLKSEQVVSAALPSTEIPKVSGLPIVRSYFQFTGDLSRFLVKQYRSLGPVFEFRVFNRSFICLAGPEANRFVQSNGRLYLRSHEFWQDFISAMGAKDALMGMDGPAHVRMRKTHTRAFSRGFIEGRLNEVVDITRAMIADWSRDRPIVAHYAMRQIIAEQIAVLTTGVSARRHIDDLIITLDSLLKVHVTQQRPGWIRLLPRQRRAFKRMDELYELVLAHHQEENGRAPDLIDDLLNLHRSDQQFFPETDLQLAILGPFFAGIETAASTVAFILYALLKHPDLLARVAVEADEFYDSGQLDAGRLRELDVTRRVIHEALRMYPVAPAVARIASNTFEFAGYRIPANSRIIVANTVPHHLSELYPDPGRFDIERFTPQRAEHRQPGAFAPFGLGTHHCLGSHFAEVQITVTLLTIIREFAITMHPADYELKIVHIPAPHPAGSFRFRIHDR